MVFLKRNNNIVLIFSVLAFLFSFVLMMKFVFLPSKDIVYVDNVKLFDSFNMTKEMKKVGQKEFNQKKKVLDSLYYLIQSPNILKKDKEDLLKKFIPLKESFENFSESYGQNESAKIWKRIEGYIKDFSKEKKYEIIMGYSHDNRVVLYGSEKVDITNDLIIYVNKRYEGK